MKNIRTDVVAYIGIASLLFALLLVYFDKATLTEVTTYGSLVALALVGIGFKLAADGSQSKSIGGGGIKNPPKDGDE